MNKKMNIARKIANLVFRPYFWASYAIGYNLLSLVEGFAIAFLFIGFPLLIPALTNIPIATYAKIGVASAGIMFLLNMLVFRRVNRGEWLAKVSMQFNSEKEDVVWAKKFTSRALAMNEVRVVAAAFDANTKRKDSNFGISYAVSGNTKNGHTEWFRINWIVYFYVKLLVRTTKFSEVEKLLMSEDNDKPMIFDGQYCKIPFPVTNEWIEAHSKKADANQ